MPNIYRGRLKDDGSMEVTVNKEPLAPRASIDIREPPGLEWGYGGSGAEQLAMAIISHEYNPRFANEWAAQFEREYIDDLTIKDEWTLRGDEILEYIPDFSPDWQERAEIFESISQIQNDVNELLQGERRNLRPGELEALLEIQDRIEWMSLRLQEEITSG